jgi:hypothetical protein
MYIGYLAEGEDENSFIYFTKLYLTLKSIDDPRPVLQMNEPLQIDD